MENLLPIIDHNSLPFTKRHVERILEDLDSFPDHATLEHRFVELGHRLTDEASEKNVFIMPSDRVQYYDRPHLFGETVDQVFPTATLDIEEAGKCYAMGRNTACVFHLMRVMEVGLRGLSDLLGNPNDGAPNWGQILSRCDRELQRPTQRSAEWNADPTFFSEATAQLRAVKDAWRNPTMHVEASYDEERTLDIWNAVSAFMRSLARKMSSRES